MMFPRLPASSTPPGSAAPPQMTAFQGYPLRNVVAIHPHDVLCGRGLSVNKHVGNKLWRDLIRDNLKEYSSLPRNERQNITHSIVMAVRSLNPPGRFLMMDGKSGTFYDIGDAKANLKTAQAMRDAKKKLGDRKKSPVSTAKPVNRSQAISSPRSTPLDATAGAEDIFAHSPPPLNKTARVEDMYARVPAPLGTNAQQSEDFFGHLPAPTDTTARVPAAQTDDNLQFLSNFWEGPGALSRPTSPNRLHAPADHDGFDQELQHMKLSAPSFLKGEPDDLTSLGSFDFGALAEANNSTKKPTPTTTATTATVPSNIEFDMNNNDHSEAPTFAHHCDQWLNDIFPSSEDTEDQDV